MEKRFQRSDFFGEVADLQDVGIKEHSRSSFWPFSPLLSRPRQMFEGEDPFEVVAHADQQPFQGNVFSAAQAEAPKAHRLFDDAKDRLDRLLTEFIKFPSCFAR